MKRNQYQPSPESSAKNFSTKIRNLIIFQLEAASPATLPLDIIFCGVHCECEKISREDVLKILRDLEGNGTILTISESGFCDRYKLVENYLPERGEEE